MKIYQGNIVDYRSQTHIVTGVFQKAITTVNLETGKETCTRMDCVSPICNSITIYPNNVLKRSQYNAPSYVRSAFWQTSSGSSIRLREMSDNHVKQCYYFVKDKCCRNHSWSGRTFSTWIKYFRLEAKHRGINL